MNPDQPSLKKELEDRLRFETLIADLSSKFVNQQCVERCFHREREEPIFPTVAGNLDP